jgi:hypothetical protein
MILHILTITGNSVSIKVLFMTGDFFYIDTIYTRVGIGGKNEIDVTDRDDAGKPDIICANASTIKVWYLASANWDGHTSYQNYIIFRFVRSITELC